MAINKIAERKQHKIENEILNILNHAIKFNSYDNELKLASFTYVKIDPKFTFAYIFVDTFNRSQISKIVNKLNEAKGYFKSELAKNLYIRKVPEIRFEPDQSIDRSIEIDKLFEKINKDKK